MKEFYVTTEVRLGVKATDEADARLKIAAFVGTESDGPFASLVTVKGMDIVAITEE